MAPQVVVTSTAGSPPTVSATASLRLDASDHAIVLRSAVGASAQSTTLSPNGAANALSQAVLTLRVARPVWGRLVLGWSIAHSLPGAGATVAVDVGDDGSYELQVPYALPRVVQMPVAFGPGELRIRTLTSASANAGRFIPTTAIGSELVVDLRPDPLTCLVQHVPVTCPGAAVLVEPIGNFARGIDARISGLLPPSTTIAALVLGTNRQNTVLPLPPFCLLLTDVAHSVLLAPAADGRAVRSLDLPPALRPLSFNLQALALETAAGTLRSSSLVLVACP